MSTPDHQKAALAGIQVVDFGHYLSGPLAGMLLADQGASVVKVQRPDSDTSHTPVTSMLNRGKHEIPLNLKEKTDADLARRLVSGADVVIENFRPGVMTRLGLGPQDMCAANPRLIYLSLPGFSASDLARSSLRAFEGILGAATGLYTDINILRKLVSASPLYSPLPLASVYGAVHGALAVTMALLAREKTGCGTVIEVPLAGAALSAMGGILFHIDKQAPRYGVPPVPPVLKKTVLPVIQCVMKRLSDPRQDKVLRRMAKLIPPFADSHQCQDGKWLFLIATEHMAHSPLLLEEMGLRQTLLAQGLVERNPYETGTLNNNLLDTGGLSRTWQARIRKELATRFATRPAPYWEDKLSRVGIACSVQRTTAQWLQSPQALEAGLTVDVPDPQLGSLRQPGVLLSLGKAAQDHWQPQPAVTINGDSKTVVESLEQLGALRKPCLQETTVSGQTTEPGRILDGIRVLDLSTVVAGPSCARTLAEYGADVIKIDPPDPKAGPRFTCWFAVEVGQGKRSMLLDLKREEGLNVFWTLLKRAQVVLHNFRPGVAERLGIDYASVKRRRPEIVYCHISAYQGPKPGPWDERRSYDPVLQAATGIMRRYGGDEKPQMHGLASCVDYLTGFSAAYGIDLALLQQRRSPTQEGDQVKTSLAQAAQWIQAPFIIASEEQQPGNEPSGQATRGEHALYRIYRARNGWIFLAGSKSDITRLAEIPALAAVPRDNEEEQIAFLQARIRTQNVDDWVRTFSQAGLGCHKVETLDEIRTSNRMAPPTTAERQLTANGRTIGVIRQPHPAGSFVDTVAPLYARFSDTPLHLATCAPKPGSDTRPILLEHGYSQQAIDTLLGAGVVREQLHTEYLPS